MTIWPLATAVALVASAFCLSRWGSRLTRLFTASALAARAPSPRALALGASTVFAAASAASAVHAFARTTNVRVACPPGIDLLNCFRAAHDTTWIAAAVALAVAGLAACSIAVLRR